MRFKNKIAIVTGGGSGIGASSAHCFISEGADVIICGRSKKVVNVSEKLKKRYREQNIIPLVVDLSEESQVIHMVKDAISKFGKIDVLINSAGISGFGKIENITLEEWNSVIKNNLTNTFLCCKHIFPHMKNRKYGKIINVSSIAGRFRSSLAGAHYTSAKAAIIAFTKQLAFEAASYNINVNVVCPSQTNTPMLNRFLTPETRERLEKSIPLGYVASPEQQAKVILFLASEDSNYMTGAVVDVNGGQF